MMQPRKAFTLMELLVVIGIIGILAGMVFAGVQVAKKASLKTKTTTILSQVSQALNSYRTLNGSYPDSYSLPTYSGKDYTDAFGTADPYKLAPAVSDTGWILANELLADQLNATGQSFSIQIKDAWGSILRYRPAKFYPYDNSATVLIDQDTNVPARDSFQLWSVGPDQRNQFGQPIYPLPPAPGSKKGDDLTSWSQ